MKTKLYTKKAVDSLVKEKRTADIIRLYEIDKAKNPVYISSYTLKELNGRQREVLKEQIENGKKLGLEGKDFETVRDFLGIRSNLSDYQEPCEYPFWGSIWKPGIIF